GPYSGVHIGQAKQKPVVRQVTTQ
nr:viral protein genome-linked 3B [Dromedary camel enterovirus 19CC]